MQCIDGCVFPYPTGSCSVARLICELKALGYSGMAACGISVPRSVLSDFCIFPARYIRGAGIRDLQKEIQGISQKGIYCMVQAGENGINRALLTTPGVHTLCDLQNAPKNAFDRFCAQNAAERNIALDIRVRPLWELRGISRQRVIRQYEEILLLQNRYEFPLTISSGALTPTDLRSARAIKALLSEIGMDQDLIRESFASIPNLMEGHRSIREVTG